MKARIASELRRSNLTAQIAAAIPSAISAYEDQRFSFDESRALTFSTVAGQEFYTSADSALIPRLQKIDYAKIIVDNYPRELAVERPEEIERINRNGTQTGEPTCYCWYAGQIRLSYIPADVWAVRIAGVVRVPAPASDDEADNPWMTTAEMLIRNRAKYELYEHVLMDRDMADRFNPDNPLSPSFRAYAQLRRRSNVLQGGEMLVEPSGW
jgi:hypothetical protein